MHRNCLGTHQADLARMIQFLWLCAVQCWSCSEWTAEKWSDFGTREIWSGEWTVISPAASGGGQCLSL